MKDFTKEKGFEQIFEQEVALPQVEVKRKIFGEADIRNKDRELEISTVPMEKEACVCCEITKDEISRVGVIMEGPQKPRGEFKCHSEKPSSPTRPSKSISSSHPRSLQHPLLFLYSTPHKSSCNYYVLISMFICLVLSHPQLS